jgi:hypothetical protein
MKTRLTRGYNLLFPKEAWDYVESVHAMGRPGLRKRRDVD